jgi:small-conductance mechanosensitive channel
MLAQTGDGMDISKYLPMIESPALKSFLAALVVVCIAAMLYSVASRAFVLAERRGALLRPVAKLLRLLLRWFALILTLLLVLGELGILQNVWAAMLAILTMVAIGFVAVWSMLSNISSTLLILIYQPFRIGDHIEVPSDDLQGEVINLNLFFTTIREESGALIQLPNNTFFQKPIRRTRGNKKVDLYEQFVSKEPQ